MKQPKERYSTPIVYQIGVSLVLQVIYDDMAGNSLLTGAMVILYLTDVWFWARAFILTLQQCRQYRGSPMSRLNFACGLATHHPATQR